MEHYSGSTRRRRSRGRRLRLGGRLSGGLGIRSGRLGLRLRLSRRLTIRGGRLAASRGSPRLLLTRRRSSASQIFRRHLFDFGPSPLFLSIFKFIPDLFDHVRGDWRGIVSPIGSHVSQDRSQLRICVLALPGLHRIIKRFPSMTTGPCSPLRTMAMR